MSDHPSEIHVVKPIKITIEQEGSAPVVMENIQTYVLAATMVRDGIAWNATRTQGSAFMDRAALAWMASQEMIEHRRAEIDGSRRKQNPAPGSDMVADDCSPA